jgi:hypothetical protein
MASVSAKCVYQSQREFARLVCSEQEYPDPYEECGTKMFHIFNTNAVLAASARPHFLKFLNISTSRLGRQYESLKRFLLLGRSPSA